MLHEPRILESRTIQIHRTYEIENPYNVQYVENTDEYIRNSGVETVPKKQTKAPPVLSFPAADPPRRAPKSSRRYPPRHLLRVPSRNECPPRSSAADAGSADCARESTPRPSAVAQAAATPSGAIRFRTRRDAADSSFRCRFRGVDAGTAPQGGSWDVVAGRANRMGWRGRTVGVDLRFVVRRRLREGMCL